MFAVFLKFTAPWKWENYWFVWSIFALIISPLVWGFVLVPNFPLVLLSSPINAIASAFFFGALWGVGGVLFGLCIARMGLALAYSLVLGINTSIGSIAPLFLNPSPAPLRTILILLSGILIIFAGLAVSAYAGIKRERIQKGRGFKTGLALAVISGITSPMANVGFVLGKPISETAKLTGVSEVSATLPIWIVALFGGFLINAGYTVYLIRKEKTFYLFAKKTVKSLSYSIISGFLWFAGIAFYGIATVLLGSLGTSAGFALLVSGTVVISNVLGILLKEWRGSREALNYQLISIAILVLGIIGIASSFSVS